MSRAGGHCLSLLPKSSLAELIAHQNIVCLSQNSTCARYNSMQGSSLAACTVIRGNFWICARAVHAAQKN